MMKNSYAGCCYLCGNYVGMGAGEVLKNRVPGQRHSLRCLPCGLAAEKPSATPTEAVLNEKGADLVRQAVRDSIRALLRDEDMPADCVRPGQLWLEAKPRPLKALYAFKERLIELRNQARERRQLAA